MNEIKIVRGDTKTIILNIYDKEDREIIVGESGQIYFTVKRDGSVKEPIIQKYIGNGIEYIENKGYVIRINPEDTNKLSYGKYKYDIEYKNGNYVITPIIDTFTIENEITFAINEV